MCGIFGTINLSNHEIVQKLFIQSLSRGKDSSGIAAITNKNIYVFKLAQPANFFIKNEITKKLINESKALIGHARMVTNGSMSFNVNNQPVIKDGMVAVHNGIIVNDKKLWKKNKKIKRQFQVDTEILLSLFRHHINKEQDLIKAFNSTIKEIEGAVSIAILFEDYNKLLLYTNTGSLYYIKRKEYFIFASEEIFLSSLKIMGEIKKIELNKPYLVDINCKNKNKIIDLSPNHKISIRPTINDLEFKKNKSKIQNDFKKNEKKILKIKRCTRCILPETMPFITFNKKGVCNYCCDYNKIKYKGLKQLDKIVTPFRKNNGKPDCLVAFSGGRDSSYMLHYVKTILKMNPIAYSYDWGMLTDLGRRNQSRMTAKLGIEHILISANIQNKRNNIKKNVEAWLKRPKLGTVPLFMAGDKQYFHYANQLMKQLDIKLLFLGECPLEKTDFKTGFCGIPPKTKIKGKFYSISLISKIQMIFYYFKEFLLNPSYINKSLWDTLWAFKSYYFIKHDYVSFYDYIKWNEEEINNTLIKQYNWEIDTETDTTWRIGDGTAAFYNYIYYTMAGFSENDTFISNQIREGIIRRDKALQKNILNNKPRIKSLTWYANTIGIRLSSSLKKINEKSL